MCLYEYLNKKLRYKDIFYFKAFGMINLPYELRFCQIFYNRVTVYVKCVVRFNVNKTLEWVTSELTVLINIYCAHIRKMALTFFSSSSCICTFRSSWGHLCKDGQCTVVETHIRWWQKMKNHPKCSLRILKLVRSKNIVQISDILRAMHSA